MSFPPPPRIVSLPGPPSRRLFALVPADPEGGLFPGPPEEVSEVGRAPRGPPHNSRAGGEGDVRPPPPPPSRGGEARRALPSPAAVLIVASGPVDAVVAGAAG